MFVNHKYQKDNAISFWQTYTYTLGGILMTGDKIKQLRLKRDMTQSDVAKRLGITRSCVNAWEMGISCPSTQYIVELANLFKVSSDYLLDISNTSSINVDGLSESEVALLSELVGCLKKSKK